MTGFDGADLLRRFHNMLTIGVICAVDHEQKKFQCQADNNKTDWLVWPADIGKNYIAWRPLRVGTQVLLACPGGELERAVCVQVLYSQSLPPSTIDENVDVVQFNDGTLLQYDSQQKHITVSSAGSIQLQAAGDITLEAGGNLNVFAAGSHSLSAQTHSVTGPVSVAGEMTVAGALSQSGGDLTSDGISLQQHKHGGVKGGGDKSGGPVSS